MSNCNNVHCVKSVQIRNFFWSVFSCIRTEYGMRENTDQKKLRTWTHLTQWFFYSFMMRPIKEDFLHSISTWAQTYSVTSYTCVRSFGRRKIVMLKTSSWRFHQDECWLGENFKRFQYFNFDVFWKPKIYINKNWSRVF